MAEFKRGLQQLEFENKNCCNCLNFRSIQNKKPLCLCTNNDVEKETGFGCALMDVHLLFQKELLETEIGKSVLNKLIGEDFICPMFLEYNSTNLVDKIRDYVIELDKDLHIHLRPSERTLEQVCYDLMQLVKEG